MMAFDFIFPDLAQQEARTFLISGDGDLPAGAYVFREFYCEQTRCDCRRVLLHVHWAEGDEIAASISYAFDPPDHPYRVEEQIFLDPLNPQTSKADTLLWMFEEMIAHDSAYRERLIRHYELWKSVVDDEKHPQHNKLRPHMRVDRSYTPVFPEREPVRRAGPKVGRNAPCPCGSGLKNKACCRV